MKPQIKRMQWRKETGWLLGALVVCMACIWPVRSLHKSAAQQASVSAQSLQVQALAQEAQKLQAQENAILQVNSAAAVQTLVQQMFANKASMQLTGDSAVITLDGIPSAQLSQALIALRQDAKAQIQQMQLRWADGLAFGRMELQMLEAQ